jgi:cell surface protein SprA
VNTDILNAIRIDFDGDRVFAENFTAFYRFNNDSLVQAFEEYTPVNTGSFSISYPIIRTAFDRETEDDRSPVYDQFLSDRQTVAYRLANLNEDWVAAGAPTFVDSVSGLTYPLGYGPNSQEVLYYSFLGAYSGQGPEQVNISSPFPAFPWPNWRLTFSGLTNIDAIAKVFRSFNINSSYRSMLSLASWRTNVQYDPDNQFQFFPETNNLIIRYDVGIVSLIEAFNPLIGIDATLQNSLSIRAEYKRSRNLAMSFVNNQLTEIRGSEIVFGLGFRVKNLKISIGSLDGSGKNSSYRSDLNVKVDFGFRDNKTTLRRIDEDNNQISAGSVQYTLNVAADYMLSRSLQLRFYLNWTSNTPYISSQFPNSTTNGGFSLRFNLAQ